MITNSYIASTVITPTTTLAAGTVYFAARNITPDRELLLGEVSVRMFYAGTATTAVSAWEWQRLAGTYTGTQVIATAARSSPLFNMAATLIDIRSGDSGCIGPAPGTTGRLRLCAMPSQNQLLGEDTRPFGESVPIYFSPGESIILKSFGAMVPGIRVVPEVIFHEFS